MKRYVIKNGEMFWTKERLRHRWSPSLHDAERYKTPGGAKQVSDMLQMASMLNIGLSFPMDVVPVCVDRLRRVRRLKV